MAAVQVDPACFEISGHMVYKRAEDFDNATEESVAQFLSYASLSPPEFEQFLLVALDVPISRA
jgi:GDP-L-galactose phosphorylase